MAAWRLCIRRCLISVSGLTEIDLGCTCSSFETDRSIHTGGSTGCHMTDQDCSPNSIQAESQIGKETGQGHANYNIIKDHQEHTLGGISHTVKCTQTAVCNCIQNIPDTDDQKISSDNSRHIIAFNK